MEQRAFIAPTNRPRAWRMLQSVSLRQGLDLFAVNCDHGSKVTALKCEKQPRGPGAGDPGSRRCRRFADPLRQPYRSCGRRTAFAFSASAGMPIPVFGRFCAPGNRRCTMIASSDVLLLRLDLRRLAWFELPTDDRGTSTKLQSSSICFRRGLVNPVLPSRDRAIPAVPGPQSNAVSEDDMSGI
jgi:hypothetical protein